MPTFEKVTLLEREDNGERSVRMGEHDDFVSQKGGSIVGELSKGVIPLDEPMTDKEFAERYPEDTPDVIKQFMDGDESEEEDSE